MNRILSRLNKKAKLTKEQENFIQECEESGKFDDDQIFCIKDSFENGLTIEQVKLFAKPNYRGLMFIAYEDFKNGFTTEQVKFYIDNNFDYHQIEEIRKGFKDGLTIEQVKSYANPKSHWGTMLQKRLELEKELNI